uniref:Uncharacterized protein n=1 Tax=Tanacetum cinerariifolium TaxID=118510 RepID=A0A6L2KEZ9_TANCI|nr:hypothetical protein [Tanacetum cinerariifolium]
MAANESIFQAMGQTKKEQPLGSAWNNSEAVRGSSHTVKRDDPRGQTKEEQPLGSAWNNSEAVRRSGQAVKRDDPAPDISLTTTARTLIHVHKNQSCMANPSWLQIKGFTMPTNG